MLHHAAHLFLSEWADQRTRHQVFFDRQCQLGLPHEIDFPACHQHAIALLAHQIDQFIYDRGLVGFIDLVDSITQQQQAPLFCQFGQVRPQVMHTREITGNKVIEQAWRVPLERCVL